MSNPMVRLLALLPKEPLQVGTVASISAGTAVITLPDGGTATARGTATVGDRVFFRAGAIESTAPALTVVLVEI